MMYHSHVIFFLQSNFLVIFALQGLSPGLYQGIMGLRDWKKLKFDLFDRYFTSPTCQKLFCFKPCKGCLYRPVPLVSRSSLGTVVVAYFKICDSLARHLRGIIRHFVVLKYQNSMPVSVCGSQYSHWLLCQFGLVHLPSGYQPRNRLRCFSPVLFTVSYDLPCHLCMGLF